MPDDGADTDYALRAAAEIDGAADPKAQLLAEKAAEQKYNLPTGILGAVKQVESSGKVDAKSSAGAKGLYGLMPDTAGNVNPYSLDAADVAGQKLKQVLDQAKGDWQQAFRYYNGGNNPPNNPENLAYPQKVIQAYTGLGGKPELIGGVAGQNPATPGAPTLSSTMVAHAPTSGTQTGSAGDFDPIAAARQIDEQMAQMFAPQSGNVSSTVSDVPAYEAAHQMVRPLNGGAYQAALEGLTLGTVDPYLAAGNQLLQGGSFAANMLGIEEGRKQYAQAHPGWNAFYNIAGSIPPLTAGTGVAEGAVAALPRVAGVLGPAVPAGLQAAGKVLNGSVEGLGGVGDYLVNTAGNTVKNALEGAGQGVAASGLNQQDPEEGAKGGALAGGVLGAASSAISPLWRRFTNAVITPAVAAVNQTAQRLGIDLPVGWLMHGNVESGTAKKASFPGQETTALQQFTNAVRRDIRLPEGTSLRPEELQEALDTQWNRMKGAVNGVNIPAGGGSQWQAGLLRAEHAIGRNPGIPQAQSQELLDLIRHYMRAPVQIGSNPNAYSVSGMLYLDLTRHQYPLDTLMHIPGPVGDGARAIQKELDYAFRQAAPPGAADQLEDAREVYARAVQLRDAVNRPNAGPDGLISPKGVQTAWKDMPTGNAPNLRTIAQFLPEPNTRGSTGSSINLMKELWERNKANLIAASVGAGAADAAHFYMNGSMLAPLAQIGAATTVGLGAPAVGNALMRLPMYKNMLIEQAFTGRQQRFLNPLIPAGQEALNYRRGDNPLPIVGGQ